ncbi:MAG: energy transducer TonB [Gemmatimonadales bacterium]|nr:energy transducer TonB [Gemmatimonadales bacterium]MYG48543.1 energy transducer TonB [Gemmatimonadales bacterium]MYK02341.1 energy transducer TonB [Candidatus Palauibacter ramosifaciens]
MEDTGIRLTANDRFKRASTNFTRIGLLVAVFLHVGLFVLVQPFEAADLRSVGNEIESIRLPPEVRMPPPPEAIARPARPRMASVDISPDITIVPTTPDRVPRGLPPRPRATDPSESPILIPYDTPPVLLNLAEVLQVLEREYPRALMDAGIEGRVELWIYLSDEGQVERSEVKTSSGNPLLDEAAGRVVPAMRFSPAKNRDRATAVWVSQWVTFRVN